jgi:hypothetical protein
MSMLLCLATLTLTTSPASAGTDAAVAAAPAGPEGAAIDGGAAAPGGVVAADDVAGAADVAGAEDDAATENDAAAATEGEGPVAQAPADMGRRRRGGRGGQGGQGGGPGGNGREGGPNGRRGQGGGQGGAPGGPPGVWAHIRPVALLQVWGTAYDMDVDPVADSTGYGDAEDDIGFKLKRVRLGLEGVEKGLDWAVVLGVTSPYDGFDEEDGSIEIVDAHLGYRWKGIGFSVGQGELPFSRDLLISSGEQTFTERGLLAEHIAPARDLGAVLFAERWGVKLQAGVYNSGGTLFGGDDNNGKTFIGRLEYAHGDASVYETWGGSKKLAFGVGAGGFMTDDVATTTRAFGADAILRVSGLTMLVDAAIADVSPSHSDLDVPGVWDQTTRHGLTGQIGYGIGAFEPAVKVSLYDDSAVGHYATGLAGVVWHGMVDEKSRDRVRIGVGYELRLEDDPIANDTVRLWAQLRP